MKRSLAFLIALLSVIHLSSYAQGVSGTAEAPINNHSSTDTSDPGASHPTGVQDPDPNTYPTAAPTRHAVVHQVGGDAIIPVPGSTSVPHTISPVQPIAVSSVAPNPTPYYPVDPVINHNAGHLDPAPSAVAKQAFTPTPYYPVDPAITPGYHQVPPAPSVAAKPTPDSSLSTSGIALAAPNNHSSSDYPSPSPTLHPHDPTPPPPGPSPTHRIPVLNASGNVILPTPTPGGTSVPHLVHGVVEATQDGSFSPDPSPASSLHPIDPPGPTLSGHHWLARTKFFRRLPKIAPSHAS